MDQFVVLFVIPQHINIHFKNKSLANTLYNAVLIVESRFAYMGAYCKILSNLLYAWNFH